MRGSTLSAVGLLRGFGGAKDIAGFAAGDLDKNVFEGLLLEKRHDGRRGAFGDDSTFMNEKQAVTDLLDVPHIMRSIDDGGALGLLAAAHKFPHFV
jgi:hypothetical protein